MKGAGFTALKDYNTYLLSKSEYAFYGSLFFIILTVFSVLFYNSFIPVIITSPLIFLYFKFVKAFRTNQQKYALSLEFKDFLRSLSASLATGYSFENAIIQSYEELLQLYGNSLMTAEINYMIKKLGVHIPVEEIFSDFANRSHLKDIETFSEIINISKRGGGDLIKIIRFTSDTISLKIEINDDINTSISGKKYELYIMALMPLIIILYISITQPGFFDCVYNNLPGICIMSISLIIYALSLFLAWKILDLEVY